MGRPEDIIAAAESQLGCPYVYGTWGQTCTVALRKRYAAYNPSQKAITYKRCAVLNGSQSSCAGCKYEGMPAYDCRGFTHWCLERVGIEITGGYVGRQWSDANWDERGDIAVMPDLVCCVFVKKSNGNWSHTGLHIGGGRIIHCSGEVKYDTVSGGSCAWTHYAVPKGLYTAEEIEKAHGGTKFMRVLKNGMRGEDVRNMQKMLNDLGYACGKADGCFGPNTLAAVEAFQQANGLAVDGIAGYNTLTLLAARAAAPTQPEEPEDSDDEAAYPDILPDQDGTPEETVQISRNDLAIMRRRLADVIADIDRVLGA